MIALEGAGDLRVHVAELAAVAFVEDHHDMRVIDRVLLVTGDEAGKLLDRRDDDARVGVFQLPLQHGGRGVGIGRALLEPFIFPHRSEEHTSELQSLMRISYAVFCLKKKNLTKHTLYENPTQP